MNQQEIIYAHKQTIAKLRHENRDLKQCCEELQVINDKLRKDIDKEME
jgi:predicted RNase H-like nuclease (RuvC/YqgF family)